MFDAIQSCLVIDQRGAGFIEIMLRFLNLFRTRAMLKLVEISLRVIDSSFGLLVGSAKFLVFETNEDLAFFDLIAFLDADPGEAPGDFGIYVDGVMRHDVTSGRQHRITDRAVFGCGAHHFNFRRIAREQAVGKRRQTYDGDRGNANDNVGACPCRRLAVA